MICIQINNKAGTKLVPEFIVYMPNQFSFEKGIS